jgi:hypothetical protein
MGMYAMDPKKTTKEKKGNISKTEEWLEDYAQQLFANWAERIQGKDSDYEWISDRITALHKSLNRTAIYKFGLKEVMSSEVPADGWRWTSILQNDEMHAGFLDLAPGATIPFHDHPESIDAMLVLDGKVEVRSYSPSHDVVAIGKQAAHLKPVNYQRLEKQGTSIILPDTGNIHGLRCLGDRAILLDVQVYQRPDVERRWYFPLGAANNDPGHVIAAAVPESLLRSAIGCQSEQ